MKAAALREAPTRRSSGKPQERDSSLLTPREALFVLKVLELDNQTEAYLQAGYRCTRPTARANAARLLAKARVQKALALARKQRLDAAEMTADEAMLGVSAIARADIRRLFGPNGQLLPIHEWPDDIAVCVKAIRHKPFGVEVVLHDKLRALEIIATAAGRLRSRHDHTHAFDHAAYLAAEPPQ